MNPSIGRTRDKSFDKDSLADDITSAVEELIMFEIRICHLNRLQQGQEMEKEHQDIRARFVAIGQQIDRVMERMEEEF
ncbi:MAG: hypothetical protein Q9218_007965 [Villophora microphyllina]